MTSVTPIKSGKDPGNLTRSAVPRYLQLASLFRRRIESGTWPVDKQIPTVEELSSECGVARATIRQALGLLESEDLISRFRAKGTFVKKRPQDLFWLQVQTDWDGLLSRREGVKIEVLSDHRVESPPMVPHPIGTLTGSYRHLRRRHWRDDAPFLLADVYIDEDIASEIDEAAFSELTALRMISQVPDVEIKDVRQTLTIGAADIEIAELMKLPLNVPVAQVYRSAIGAKGQIVMISMGTYRGDIVRVDTQLEP
jgi:GntR family transcriptional regulator